MTRQVPVKVGVGRGQHPDRTVHVPASGKSERLPAEQPLPIVTQPEEPKSGCQTLGAANLLTIKDLGRWESLEMVQRYTRSVSFQDSMRFYRAPLS